MADRRSETAARLRAAGCVFAEDEADLLLEGAGSDGELDQMVGLRVAGHPLEHVVGWAGFCQLRIRVGNGVFVPRRRTEFLAQQAVAAAGPGRVVVDLCCGSGAVAAVLLAVHRSVVVHAVDVDAAAVRCARRNVGAAGGQVHHGDLYEPLPPELRGRVEVLVANAPYVPTAALGLLPAEARLFEPRVALDGGVDGLDVQRRVIAGAGSWLAPHGRLLVETSAGQVVDTVEVFTRYGFHTRVVQCVDLDATVVIGAFPGAGTGGRPPDGPVRNGPGR